MRRPISALATAFLGTFLAATTVSAQQSPPSSDPGAGAPSPASATAPAPTFAPPINPARGARHLLRNGWDYVTYQEYERALAFFREAETRQKELSEPERLRLKQGIERAQRGLREVSVGMKTEGTYARSGRSIRPGAIALAAPATTSAPIEREPIQLASGTGPVPDTHAVNATVATPTPTPAPPPAASSTPAALPSIPDIDTTPLPALGAMPAAPKPAAEPARADAVATASIPAAPAEAPAPAPLTATDPAPASLAPPSPAPGEPKAMPIAAATGPQPPTPTELPPVPELPPPPADPAAASAEAPTAAPAAAPAAEPESLPPLPQGVTEQPAPAPAAPAPAPAAPAPAAPAPAPADPKPAPAEAPEPAPAPAPAPVATPVPDAQPGPPVVTLPASADPTPLPAGPGPETPPTPMAAPDPEPAPAAPAVPVPAAAAATTATATATATAHPDNPFLPRPHDVGPSTLSPELRREVEQIAQKQEEELRRKTATDAAQPPAPAVDAAGPAQSSPASTRLEISRAPSPTEARPIRAIPVPEEFVALPKREWDPNRKYWAAAATCHLPLYFQDASLERYGYSVEQRVGPLGRFLTVPLDDPRQSKQRNQILQPFASIGLFAFQIGVLPWNLIMDPPWESEYDLGYYRPGDRVPTDVHYLPLTGVGPPLHGANYGRPPARPVATSTARW